MHTFDALRHPLPSWANWITLALMSYAAPVIAGCIHSLHVILGGFRLYNAEIGGIYFHDTSLGGQSIAVSVLNFVGICAVPAALTFVVLLLFRKRPQLCRAVWIGIVLFWLWFCFRMEVALR